MYLRNPFPVHKREVFRNYQYICGNCGQNGQNCGGTEIHHIRSRISSSVFNGICLCKKCHSAVGHTFKEEQKYLQKTATIVFRAVKLNNYILDENDKNFLIANEKYY